MKVPASHLAQVPCCARGCTVPGLQGVWSREPVEQAEPCGHDEHWPLLPRPGVLLYVPSLHGSAEEAPRSQ